MPFFCTLSPLNVNSVPAPKYPGPGTSSGTRDPGLSPGPADTPTLYCVKHRYGKYTFKKHCHLHVSKGHYILHNVINSGEIISFSSQSTKTGPYRYLQKTICLSKLCVTFLPSSCYNIHYYIFFKFGRQQARSLS